jgi:hypothetical protein
VKVSLTFAGGLVITLAVAFTVVKYLTTPLRQQLQELWRQRGAGGILDVVFQCHVSADTRGVRNAGGSMGGRLRSAAGRCGVACEVGAYRAGNVSPHAGSRFRPVHSPNTRTPSLSSCRTESGR